MQHHVVFVKNATGEVETAYAKAIVFESQLTKGLVYALISARPARLSRLGPSSLVFFFFFFVGQLRKSHLVF